MLSIILGVILKRGMVLLQGMNGLGGYTLNHAVSHRFAEPHDITLICLSLERH